MDLLDMMSRGVAVPVLTSSLVVLVANRPWKRRPVADATANALPAALAVTAGYGAGHLALINWSWPGFPPAETTHWSLFLALAALLVGYLMYSFLRRPSAMARWSLRGLLVAAAIVAVARPLLGTESFVSTVSWIALLTAGTVLWWVLAEQTGSRQKPAAFLATLLVVLSGASIALVISGTGLVAQLVGALTAALGPLLLPAVLRGEPVPAPALSVVAVVLGALWANGVLYTYAELNAISLLLLAASALALAAAAAPPVQRLAASPRPLVRWSAAAVPAASSLIPLAAAIALALSRSAEMIY